MGIISCQEVWKDVSDYIDNELEPLRRAALDRHFAGCRHCTALLEGMRNVITIYQDERIFAPPDGFHERLRQKLEKETKRSRRKFLAWSLAAAAAVPLAFVAFSARKLVLPGHETQRPASEPERGEQPNTVAISEDHDDKLYHVPGCSHLAGQAKFLTVQEAVREGYTPCVFCIAKAKPKKTG
jgi:predicted anti-sigma-YlaC factor YlaD